MKKIILSIGLVFFLGAGADAKQPAAEQIGYFDSSANLLGLLNGDAVYTGYKAFRFDHQSLAWSEINKSHVPRIGHISLQLSDGRLLISGGEDRNRNLVNQPEIYNSQTGEWTLLPASPSPFWSVALVQISTYEVLIVGHDNGSLRCNKGYVLNIASGSWSDVTGSDTYCPATKAYKLASGKVMVLSEVNDLHVKLFDPKTYKWADEYSGVRQPSGFGGVSGLTSDAKAFIAVMSSNSYPYTNAGKLIEYDESRNLWLEIANLPHDRDPDSGNFGFGESDGRLVLYGWRDEVGYDGDVYDPKLNIWTSFGAASLGINYSPRYSQACLLGNKVLVVPPNPSGMSALIDIP